MTRVLCTFPGRHGDLLWALPTVRAISESYGQPVDLQIAGEFGTILPLLALQPYLGAIFADPRWGLTPPNEWQAPPAWPPRRADGVYEHFSEPPDPLVTYDRVYQLGYRRWPELPLPLEVDQTVRVDRELPPLDLTRPWITAPPTETRWFDADYHRRPRRIAVGFTECYFELKYGLTKLVTEHHSDWRVQTCMGGGRWFNEAGEGSHTWVEAAQLISQAEIFVGDCSGLHVLAVALGVPVVLVEPMDARWNPIFYPCGKTGPQVTLVTGLDGLPTFDSRHLCETVAARLEAIDA